MSLKSIVNIKAGVQSKEVVMDVRNHIKARSYLYPDTNSKAPWIPTDTITFTLNSAEMSYLNLNSSILWAKVHLQYDGVVDTPAENEVMIYDIAKLFSRFRNLNAGNILEDIQYYHRWMEMKRRMTQKLDPDSGLQQYTSRQPSPMCHAVAPYSTDTAYLINVSSAYTDNGMANQALYGDNALADIDRGQWFPIPFSCGLDGTQPSLYLPMYQLATKNQLEFTVNEWWEVFHPINAGQGAPDEQALIDGLQMYIMDTYIECIGLRCTEGAIKTPIPFVYKTIGVHGSSAEIASGKTRYDYSLDVSRSSVRNTLHSWTPIEANMKKVSVNVLPDVINKNINWMTSSTFDNFADFHAFPTVLPVEFAGYLGGTLYPYQQPIRLREMYTEFERYRHQVDNSGIPIHDPNMAICLATYTHQYLNVIPNVAAFLYGVIMYDPLDQIGSLIGGMDTDRYPFGTRVALREALKENKMWNVFVEYWRVDTWAGGKINIEE